jgi:hypothetical protein
VIAKEKKKKITLQKKNVPKTLVVHLAAFMIDSSREKVHPKNRFVLDC